MSDTATEPVRVSPEVVDSLPPSRSPSPLPPSGGVPIAWSPVPPILGNHIPMGFVLFTLQLPNTRRRSFPTGNNSQGALVRRPESYQAAAKVALRFLGDMLGVTSVDDILLKRAVQHPNNYGDPVYAAFDPEDWDAIIVGQTTEIGVYKVPKAVEVPAHLPFEPQPFPPDSPYMTPAPMPIYPDVTISNWLNAKPIPPEPVNEPKTMQLTWEAKDEMALVNVPPTYEACEKLAREVFKPKGGDPMSLKAAVRSPNGNPGKLLIHPGVYETSVLNYYGQLQLYVNFGDEGRDTKDSGKAQNRDIDEFLMI